MKYEFVKSDSEELGWKNSLNRQLGGIHSDSPLVGTVNVDDLKEWTLQPSKSDQKGTGEVRMHIAFERVRCKISPTNYK